MEKSRARTCSLPPRVSSTSCGGIWLSAGSGEESLCSWMGRTLSVRHRCCYDVHCTGTHARHCWSIYVGGRYIRRWADVASTGFSLSLVLNSISKIIRLISDLRPHDNRNTVTALSFVTSWRLYDVYVITNWVVSSALAAHCSAVWRTLMSLLVVSRGISVPLCCSSVTRGWRSWRSPGWDADCRCNITLTALNLVSWFPGKLLKLFATRCHILRLKCTNFDFGWGSVPDPAWGAYSAPPDPLVGLRGPTSKGRGEEGKEVEGREGEGEGRGREREREGVCTIGNRHPPDEILATPLCVHICLKRLPSD